MRIAITGTPGTGKTEVAKILSEKLEVDLIDIKPLLERSKVGFDKKRDSDIIDETVLSKEFEKIKGNFVIEGHMAHFIDSKDVDFCIVLMTNSNELRKRLLKRGWDKEKIEENVLAEQMKICYGEAIDNKHKCIVYDTSNKTSEESVKEILEMI